MLSLKWAFIQGCFQAVTAMALHWLQYLFIFYTGNAITSDYFLYLNGINRMVQEKKKYPAEVVSHSLSKR